ncbi:MAG: TIGR04283 family arsenosugar biosynthesis glycosyltransferase [Gammaproteobacteria bacterium]|nr:TIGR04283 family arsenosugar biosynthesis glycosyltransferase [Gammaproteobacteria bacterium]
MNEEKTLPATLREIFKQRGDYEVIVVDGGSSDWTCAIARAESRVRLFTASRGRARQMNAGARVACGEWLLFLHADTVLPADALQRLNALEADASCAAGGFRHRFSGKHWGLRLISWMHNLRCRLTKVFYGDQALFVRHRLFEQLGGFPQEPILEDVLFCEKLRKATRPVLLNDYVVTDSRKFEQMGVWRSLARVALILTCYELGLPIAGKVFFSPIR